MAKSAPAKKKSVASVRSRAAKRASSPSIDTDKSLKDVKPPTNETRPAVLGIHHSAGVSKKSKHGRKAVLSAKAKRRQEMAMDRAEATMDKKSIRIEKSKNRARTVQNRSKTWDEQNRKLLAKQELEAAMALENGKEEWVDESDDGNAEKATASHPTDVGDAQMDFEAEPVVSTTHDVVAAEDSSDEEL